MATASENQKSLTPDTTSVSVTHIERLYIQRALDQLTTTLNRSKTREMPGSSILQMRENEIEMISQLRKRFN